MSQFLRPDSTVTATSFTNGFANIDEAVASDADFAFGANNTAAVLEVGLGNPQTPGSGTTTIRYRVAKTNNGTVDGAGATVTVTCSVRQGANVIATDSARTATGTWTQYSFAPDMSSVTDWSDLRLRFTTSASGGTTANRRGGAVSWAELEAPDAPSGVTGTMAATESGEDSFAGSGTVSDQSVTGSLTATEIGADTATASGSVTVAGSLAATETGADTSFASGTVAVTGAASATESGSDSANASGSVGIGGSLAASEAGSDGFAGSGSVESDGITGSLSATESGSDNLAAEGFLLVSGALAGAETGSDGFSGSGSVGSGDGLLAATETGEDEASFAGQVLVEGMLTAEDIGEDVLMAGSLVCSRRTAKTSRTPNAIHSRPANISRGAR